MFFTLKHFGIGLIFLGVSLLAMLYFLHYTLVNALLVVPLCMVICGLAIFVWGQKRESSY